MYAIQFKCLNKTRIYKKNIYKQLNPIKYTTKLKLIKIID